MFLRASGNDSRYKSTPGSENVPTYSSVTLSTLTTTYLLIRGEDSSPCLWLAHNAGSGDSSGKCTYMTCFAPIVTIVFDLPTGLNGIALQDYDLFKFPTLVQCAFKKKTLLCLKEAQYSLPPSQVRLHTRI